MNKTTFHHIPVLKDEVIKALNIRKGGKYIDATIGAGGHAEEIYKRGGTVLGIDQDEDAHKAIKERFGSEILLARDNFSNIKNIARKHKFYPVDGILLDIGVSSHQLDTPERGFSYRFDSPLDMRMDTTQALSAVQVINTYTQDELEDIFARYGELEDAQTIAAHIIKARRKKKIITPSDLEAAIGTSNASSKKSRIYQAIRMEVNNEIPALKMVLRDALELLDRSGILCVITFHSLEDRIVKEFGRKVENDRLGRVITKKPITPTDSEISRNKRSKSSKLRVIEKL